MLCQKGVIPTFLIDLPIMLLFGALFALFTSKEVPGGSIFSSRYFWHGLVFTTLFNAVVFYSALKFPDWMWMYFLENSRMGGVTLAYLFLFLYYIPYAAGFYLGRDAVRRGFFFWLVLALLFVVAEIWLVWKLFDRYSVIGTRTEYLEGKGISLFSPENPIGLYMNGTVGLMIIYYLWVAWHYRRSQKKSLV